MSDVDTEDLEGISELGSDPEAGSEEETPDSAYGSEEDTVTDDGEDREYTGNMFGNPPRKFAAGPFEQIGQHNSDLGTNDYCCISIWSTGGAMMRYTRLKDTIMRIPPVANDCMFRVGHDAKRVYYLGEEKGKKKLVVVWLKDLSHYFFDLGQHADQITTLEDSSLFRNYLCYRVEERVEKKQNKKLVYYMQKNFHVIDIKTGKSVWNMGACEKVFFAGQLASDLKSVQFIKRKIKLRKADEQDSDFEEEASDEENATTTMTTMLTCEDEPEDKKEYDKDEEGFKALSRGILVVKMSEEEVTEEAAPEEDKVNDDAADKGEGEGEGKKKDDKKKKVLMKVFKAYLPQWRQKIDVEKRKFWETKFEIKNTTTSSSNQATELILDESQKNVQAAVKKEQNEVIMTSDNECSILALVVKGMKGEQHKVILFDWDKEEPLTMVNRAATTDLEFNMNSHIRPRNQIFIVQTESNNTVTAKQLEFDKDEAEAAGTR